MSTVLVTGATGHLGTLLVERLEASGHDVRVFSRRPAPSERKTAQWVTGNLIDGSGLAQAVHEVDTVVHCASDPRTPVNDVRGTEQLLRAIDHAGGKAHLLYVSIVGVDAIPWSYYRAKHQAEQAIVHAAPRWTIQRATQFHPFIETMLSQLARSPVMPLPRGFCFQPVATHEVAERLVDHIAHGPAGRATDFGGPEILPVRHLARTWLEARGRHRASVTIPLPGRLSNAFRRGVNLSPAGDRGVMTWHQYLSSS